MRKKMHISGIYEYDSLYNEKEKSYYNNIDMK